MKICVNAGHGKRNNGVVDVGAVGATGYKEYIETKELADLVGAKLKSRGFEVLVIQDGDLYDITNKANDWKADYFVSIHCNAATAQAHGVETFALSPGGKGEQLAHAVHKFLLPATSLSDRGVKFANYHVLRETEMPAILTEVGFISNSKEEALMKDANWDNKIAESITQGICSFTGVTYQAETIPHVEPSRSEPITIVNAPVNHVEAPVQKETERRYSYPNNARATAKLPVKDGNGNLSRGHYVSAGDIFTVINVSYSSGLVELEYPVGSNQVRHGFVSISSNIVYLSQSAWHNGSTTEITYNEANKNLKIGLLFPYEKATPLYKKNGFVHLVYNTDLGVNSKSGYVSYMGS